MLTRFASVGYGRPWIRHGVAMAVAWIAMVGPWHRHGVAIVWHGVVVALQRHCNCYAMGGHGGAMGVTGRRYGLPWLRYGTHIVASWIAVDTRWNCHVAAMVCQGIVMALLYGDEDVDEGYDVVDDGDGDDDVMMNMMMTIHSGDELADYIMVVPWPCK